MYEVISDLSRVTLRIEMLDEQENCIGSGTGFLFDFEINPTEFCRCLVSNKHVLEPSNKIRLTFPTTDDYQNVNLTKTFSFVIQTKTKVLSHPDPNVDLAVVNITRLLIGTEYSEGNKLFHKTLTHSMIPSSEEWSKFISMEEIVMIGYPNGIWDDINCLPIIRRGVTASNPSFNYRGKNEFMIDAACFPGSSGSPIFLCKKEVRQDPNDNQYKNYTHIFLLGVLYSGPILYSDGKVLSTIEDLATGEKTATKTMLNLGYVIKSNELLELLPQIKEATDTKRPQLQ